MVPTSSTAAAVPMAPATACDESLEVEGCDAAPLLFLGAMDDEDRRAGYCFRFAQVSPPTWRAKDVGVEARSPMGQGCPFVVRQGDGHIAQRAEAIGDNMAMDNSLLPRFGPLCSVKPYSCYGGLIWRNTKARRALVRQGCLGENSVSVQVLRDQMFEPLARLPRASFYTLRGDHSGKTVISG
jgi:hypothetical protein